MRKHVTIIPADKLIMVDGDGIYVTVPSSNIIHAIQWHDGKGHIEYTDGRLNKQLTAEDYSTEIAPYVDLWKKRKTQIDNSLSS